MELLETPASASGEPANAPATTTPATTPSPNSERAFADYFSDEYKPSLSKFKDHDALGKAYLELQKFMGTDKAELIRKPKDGTPEAMNEFYNSIGRPNEAKDYQINMPEGTEFDQQALAAWQDHFHKAGLTNEQANAVIAPFLQEINAAQEKEDLQKQVEVRDNKQLLKSAWGPEFEENKNLFLNMCDKIADTKEQAEHLKNIWAQDPQSLMALAKLAKQSATATDFGNGRNEKLTPSSIRTRLAEIQQNPLWFDATQSTNPERLRLVDEFTRLNGLVNNGR
jgi:hypothetical protein